jgi:CubicO group peptidase (beta-lactamase class C family)
MTRGDCAAPAKPFPTLVRSAASSVLLALPLLLLAPAPAAPGPVDAKAIDAIVQRALQSWHVPGVAVAIVRGDQVVYLKGHGLRDLDSGEPVTPDTLFAIGSCTKAFTSTALAILVDEGKVSWDEPARRHVPFFHLSDPQADADVRLRDLLCHRTGLASHNLLWYHSPFSAEEQVRRAAHLPLDKPFRSAFQYQSTMYSAAGLAVRAAAGMPWDAFVQRRLLDPLGMRRTVFTSAAALAAPDHAEPHVARPSSARPEVMLRYRMDTPDAAGSIHSSARDLARWLRFHLAEGALGTRRLVSAATLKETHSPQTTIRLRPVERALFPDTIHISYGLAWVVHDYRGVEVVGHGGAIDGFRTQLTMVPAAGLGIVLLCNLHQTEMNLALSNSLLDLLLGLPGRDWNAVHQKAMLRSAAEIAARERLRLAGRQPGTHPSRPLADYAGAYEHPAYGRVRVRLENDRLVWSWHDFHAALEHFQDDTFTLPIATLGPTEVIFSLEGGAVAAMKVTGPLKVEFRKLKTRAER